MAEFDEERKQNVLRDMAVAISTGDWQASYDAFHAARSIDQPEARADLLNQLLVMPGHTLHQEVTREIQLLRSASSVPYIRKVLESGFGMLEYTGSDSGVIAKWFSHALADIDTPESIALIKEFAACQDPEIAEEMSYRLERLNRLEHLNRPPTHQSME